MSKFFRPGSLACEVNFLFSVSISDGNAKQRPLYPCLAKRACATRQAAARFFTFSNINASRLWIATKIGRRCAARRQDEFASATLAIAILLNTSLCDTIVRIIIYSRALHLREARFSKSVGYPRDTIAESYFHLQGGKKINLFPIDTFLQTRTTLL